ncbi:cytochrome c family protein [Aureimonas fodinaquatilis]|uniref:Cytochrome c family protein n=1 Tax=Aureimonas fodinaquatilis TaxID=2565783 RepID=A0A5B0E128_9HYPH|nr:cytochrome c family protein [Aureimonas fodinaquatilis]KAA0972338.1 cytochrome c family protein [Aureimonas fodinaquatilis]
MNPFEANKIFGAVLGTIFVLFGGSLLAEGIFHSEIPETPGYAIEVAEVASGAAEAPAAVPIAVLMQDADAAAGENIFKRCQSCHSPEKGGPNLVGPDLWDILNRPIASHEGFSYSAAMQQFSEDETVPWDYEHLDHFLKNPRQYISGTAMSFAGVNRDGDRADLIAYLRSLSDSPAPLPEPEAEAPAEGGEAAPVDGSTEPGTTTDSGAGETQAPATEPTQEAPAATEPAQEAPAATEPAETTPAPAAEPAPEAPAAEPAPAQNQ